MSVGKPFSPVLLRPAEESEKIPVAEADLSEAEKAGFEQYLLQQRPHLLKQFLNRQPFSRFVRQNSRSL